MKISVEKKMFFFFFFFFFPKTMTRRGGSNEYLQSRLWSKNKKNMYTPANLFHYIKVGFKGVFISRICFPGVFKSIYRCKMN